MTLAPGFKQLSEQRLHCMNISIINCICNKQTPGKKKKIIFRSVMHVGKYFFILIFLILFFWLKMTWIALYYIHVYKHQKLTSNSFFNVLKSTHNLIVVVMIAFLAFTLVREQHLHMHLATKSCLDHVVPDVKRSIKTLFIKKIN